MRVLILALVLAVVAVVAVPGALGYAKGPKAKPAVKAADVKFFTVGRECVNRVEKAFSLLDRASRRGKFNLYVAGAESLTKRGERCVTSVGQAKPVKRRGRAAKPVLVRAMRQYRNAGSKFELAASAQKRDDRGEAIALTNQAAVHLQKARTLTKVSNRLIRGLK